MEAAVKIKFPDGSEKDFPKGITGEDIAKSISSRLAKEAIAVKVAGRVQDLKAPVDADAPVEILTFDNPEGRAIFWHSSSHIMAQAVLDLFPEAKLAIGPSIEEGFYYDFEVSKPFSPEDLERVEKRMQEIIKEKAEFQRIEVTREEMLDRYKKEEAVYKVESVSYTHLTLPTN